MSTQLSLNLIPASGEDHVVESLKFLVEEAEQVIANDLLFKVGGTLSQEASDKVRDIAAIRWTRLQQRLNPETADGPAVSALRARLFEKVLPAARPRRPGYAGQPVRQPREADTTPNTFSSLADILPPIVDKSR